jgi:hypothetical protein
MCTTENVEFHSVMRGLGRKILADFKFWYKNRLAWVSNDVPPFKSIGLVSFQNAILEVL